MEIECTRRIMEFLYQLHVNFQRSAQAAMLESELDGYELGQYQVSSPKECKKVFKNLMMEETGFTEAEYDQTIFPLKIISGDDFAQNPYLQNMVLEKYQAGDIALLKEEYPAYCLIPDGEPVQDAELSQKFQYSVFDKSVMTYFLETKEFAWMSITPTEVNTMKKGIRDANGNLLVLGGGLGYFPYMCSLREEITSITIIEKDPIIKKMLKEQILPQFPNDKAMIIEADAYEFMDSGALGEYNSVFADIWENNLSGEAPYLKLVKYENKYPDIHFDYWLEDSILNSAVSKIFMYFRAKTDPDYERIYVKQSPAYYEYLESIPDKIERPEQMGYYLNRRFAKEMMKHIGDSSGTG